ncbi:MAG: transporter substrate-binding domain-containing protein [Litoreibacter sp.]
MRHNLLTVLSISAIALASTGHAENLRIGTSADFPPWESVNEKGEIVGFDRQIGDEICARINAECEWVNQGFDGLLPSLAIGRFDLVISGISITAEREKEVAFSAAYADAPNSFVTALGSDLAAAETRDDLEAGLEGAVVGVQVGSTHEAVLVAHFSGATVRTYERPEQILADIRVGRIQAGLTERSVWDSLLADDSTGIAFAGPLLTSTDYSEFGRGQGIVLAQESTELLGRVNVAVEAMLADGTITQFSNEAFGYDLSAN